MKKWILLGFLALIIISGAIAFYILSQPPKEKLSQEFKEKAVTKLLGRKAQLEAKNIPTGNTEYKGKFINFSYPAKAVIYEYRDNKNSANLEDFSFDIKSPKLVFNMTVTSAAANLDEIPAVRLRETRGYEYKKEIKKIAGVDGYIYYKSGTDPEKSGFFIGNSKLFTLTVTGVTDEEVGKLFDEIISSVSLKQ